MGTTDTIEFPSKPSLNYELDHWGAVYNKSKISLMEAIKHNKIQIARSILTYEILNTQYLSACLKLVDHLIVKYPSNITRPSIRTLILNHPTYTKGQAYNPNNLTLKQCIKQNKIDIAKNILENENISYLYLGICIQECVKLINNNPNNTTPRILQLIRTYMTPPDGTSSRAKYFPIYFPEYERIDHH